MSRAIVIDGPPTIESVTVTTLRIPTERPESDGTLEWSSTQMVLVEVASDGCTGVGYTYSHAATATLIREQIAPQLLGVSAQAPPRAWVSAVAALRNLGRGGIASAAVAAVDIALWDLHARLAGVALCDLLGRVRDAIPGYGSGGFTSYDDHSLARQMQDYAEQGLRMVKMKVGRDPGADPHRVELARASVRDDCELFVDANGAYAVAEARALAQAFARADVRWFEEPVSSDDLAGLVAVRRGAPPGMAIAAGEYGFDAYYFARMLGADAVDVLQVDATRCAGVTGFVQAAALCVAHGRGLSTHCAPAIHAHLACASIPAVHAEIFHDHQRIESICFDGVPELRDGCLIPPRDRPGLGLEVRWADVRRYVL